MAESSQCCEEWKFRGEGNACLVLTNVMDKTVYRLPKAKHWGKGHLNTLSKTKMDCIHEEMEMVIDYMKYVMQPLLSPAFVVLPELRLTHGELPEAAEFIIRDTRPAQRKGRDVEHTTIDPTTLSALVMPDLCYVRHSTPTLTSHRPTISVEIKPKKAFMHVHDESLGVREEKSQVCKFCMHQRLKAKEGEWPETSRYCPLDLFSGNRDRMKQALLALGKTPQNNLRICQDGEEIHGAVMQCGLNSVLESFFNSTPPSQHNGLHKHTKLFSRLMDLVLSALLYVPETETSLSSELEQETSLSSSIRQGTSLCSIRAQSTGDVMSSTILKRSCQNSSADLAGECCALPGGCVLERILCVQQLDGLDIDGVSPLYHRLHEHFQHHPADRHAYNINGPYSGEDWLLACTGTGSDPDLILDNTISTMVRKVKRFLVSKTVQDCSIMVALQPLSPQCNEAECGPCLKDSEGQMFNFSVSVVDLDPKPFCKIPRYVKQDQDIVTAFQEACLQQA